MSDIHLSGFLFNASGAALESATVEAFAKNTVTETGGTAAASTTTNSSGYYTMTVTSDNEYDVRITSGNSVRWRRFDDRVQMEEIEVSVLNLREGATAQVYTIAPGSISADRTLTLPAATADDTLASIGLAQTFSAAQTIEVAGVPITIENSTNNASNQVAIFRGDNSTRADGDEIYVSFLMDDDGGNSHEFARITAEAVDVSNGSEDGQLRFGISVGGTMTDVFQINASTGGATSITFEQDSVTIKGEEGGAGIVYLMADQGDDAGDEWRVQVADGGTLTWGNDIASAGSYVTHMTLAPNATVANSTLTLGGSLNITTVAAAGTDTDKFLVLDSGGNVDYRTGTQVLSDIGGSVGSTVTVTDNESTDEDNLIAFVADAATSTGDHGLEMDGDLTYNPSTGRLTATQLAGTLQTASQTNITAVGTIATGVWEGTTVAVAQGGTGATSLTDKAVLISQDSGTDTVGSVALTSSGQIIIGGSSGPAAATLTAGTNITITNGDGSISIAASGGGVPNPFFFA
jgi:hypothetical protein